MRNRLGTACLLLVLLTPAPAAADVSDADRATARVLAVEGQEALDKREFDVALDRFRRADEIIHAPTLLLGVARAQVGLGKWIAAQEAYSRILREGAPDGSPEPFFAAIEDARRELEALTPRIPHVLVVVNGAAAPDVTIDGEPVPRAALGVKRPVDPGVRVIRATAPGLTPTEAKLTIVEGASETVALELKPSETRAEKSVPLLPVTAPPGDAAASTAGDGQRTLAFAALGLGVAGLGVGAVTGIMAVSKHKDLEAACGGETCPPTLEGEVSNYRTMGTVSTIGFVVGVVGAGAGAYLLLTAPKAPPRAGTWVTPVLGLGYAGARGRF